MCEQTLGSFMGAERHCSACRREPTHGAGFPKHSRVRCRTDAIIWQTLNVKINCQICDDDQLPSACASQSDHGVQFVHSLIVRAKNWARKVSESNDNKRLFSSKISMFWASIFC